MRIPESSSLVMLTGMLLTSGILMLVCIGLIIAHFWK
jgi:hypothetical protein